MTSSFTLAGIIILPLIYYITRAIYRLYFDGLSGYPGPKLWAISSVPFSLAQIRGKQAYDVAKFHSIYGPIVRVGPHALSYVAAEAWNDIYTARPQLIKDPNAGPPPPNGVKGLAFTDKDADHSRMRRNLSHGFSEKALREQESLLLKYVDIMIQKLNEARLKGPVDMSAWLNFVTVDIIGDLTFGESFHCLETSTLHSWMENIFFFLKAFVIAGSLSKALPFVQIIMWLAKKSKSFGEKEAKHRGFINQSLAARLARDDPRTDFMTYVQKHTGTPTGMSIDELRETCNALILGGSETTASAVSGAIYYLLKNPTKMDKLTREIRSSFKKDADIDFVSTNRLTYQAAVLEESLRIFPPLPQQMMRVSRGNTIAGRYVPPGNLVGIMHWPCYHSASNFKDPFEFVPERWLGDEQYKNDRKDAFKPFSNGPRNCIGINLAYAEMRLILARLLWNFDMELCEESNDWVVGMKIFAVYQRPPLMVMLTPVARDRIME